MQDHFLPLTVQKAISMKSKKRWFKLSNGTLKSFSASFNQKCDFFEFDKATIQVVDWHLKVIFFLLTTPNFGFGDVEKAMLQVVARHWELIFFLLTSVVAGEWGVAPTCGWEAVLG